MKEAMSAFYITSM